MMDTAKNAIEKLYGVEIEHRFNGNILDSDAVIIFNPVTDEGSMGRGLSKRIRKKYPAMYRKYRTLCQYRASSSYLKLVYKITNPTNKTAYIVNLSIKESWGDYITKEQFMTAINRFANLVIYDINYDYSRGYGRDRTHPVTIAMPIFFLDINDHTISDMINVIARRLSHAYINKIMIYHNEIV